MAKRELIDRKTLINNGLSKGFCEWYDEIKQAEVITEQDIVEPILNKIRAEIEKQVLESLSDGGDDWFTAEKVNECLDIIDKYKAESENT